MRRARFAWVVVAGFVACGGKTTGEPVDGGGAGGQSVAVGTTVGGGPMLGPGPAVGVGGMPGVGGSMGGGDPGGGTGGVGVGVTYCPNGYSEPVRPTSPLISDFETGLVVQAVRPGGTWRPLLDGMGTTTVLNVPCGTTGNGLRFAGKGHSVWGAAIEAALASVTQPVDVSSFRGLSFVINSQSATPLIVKVENPYSQPACGKCDDTVAGADCRSGYIKNVLLPVQSTTTLVVLWSDLAQQTWGYRAPGTAMFDPRNLVDIMFAFDKNVDFDVCIDDVKLVP